MSWVNGLAEVTDKLLSSNLRLFKQYAEGGVGFNIGLGDL